MSYEYPEVQCLYCSTVGQLVYNADNKQMVCDFCTTRYGLVGFYSGVPERDTLVSDIVTTTIGYEEPDGTIVE